MRFAGSATFQYPLCRIVGVNQQPRRLAVAVILFQYPLCRIVGVNVALQRERVHAAIFQYPLCRIVGVNSQNCAQ